MSKYDYPYVVISAEQIAPLPNPGFPAGGRSEEDFRGFLAKCQEWFLAYPHGGTDWVDGADLSYVYEDMAQAVTVHQNEDGTYSVATNGRHRMYICRKYGLSMLVCVMP